LGKTDQTRRAFQKDLGEPPQNRKLPKEGSAKKKAAVAERDSGKPGRENEENTKETGAEPPKGKKKLRSWDQPAIAKPWRRDQAVQ
jgi:hypothetical protein